MNSVKKALPNKLGIHCHNDCGVAVANSLAAIAAGARQIQGTINGIGERCGNADLISLIPTLVLKTDYITSVAEENLPRLMNLSRLLDERLGRVPMLTHLMLVLRHLHIKVAYTHLQRKRIREHMSIFHRKKSGMNVNIWSQIRQVVQYVNVYVFSESK